MKRIAMLMAAGVSLVLSVQAWPSRSPDAGRVDSSGSARLLFSDEFNGTTLDASRWHTCSWWASTTCSIETNNELELYTPDNVSVTGGELRLEARREAAVGWNDKTYNYTSGMISSGGQDGMLEPGFTFTYGYMEARVKVPAGQGLWPAFWTLPADHSWPPEIDGMEILSGRPTVAHMTYHYTDVTGTHRNPSHTWAGPDFSSGWHTFGVDWETKAITWYVDGVKRWQFTDAAAITSAPSYLVLNLAVGGDRVGVPDASMASLNPFLVDYVRVWDRYVAPVRSGRRPPGRRSPLVSMPSPE